MKKILLASIFLSNSALAEPNFSLLPKNTYTLFTGFGNKSYFTYNDQGRIDAQQGMSTLIGFGYQRRLYDTPFSASFIAISNTTFMVGIGYSN